MKTATGAPGVFSRLAGDANPERFLTPPASAVDRTQALEEFRNGGLWAEDRIAAAFTRIRPRLEGVRFLLMPCYLADFLKIPKRLKLSDYFDAQVAVLRTAGLHFETVDVNSQDTIASNAEALHEKVSGSTGRVFIISHSKGGLDTLEFLVNSEAALLDRIAGWLSFQAPFAGAPLADRVAQIDPVRRTAELLLTAFGGSGGSLHDLCTDGRARYMARQDAAIRRIVQRVPILSVTAAIDGGHSMKVHATPMYPTLLWMRQQGIRSDGMVPTNSAILPHAPYVVLAPVDHTGTVAKGVAAQSFQDRMALTKALIALLLGQSTGDRLEG